MDIGSLAGALVAAQAGQLQSSIGTAVLRSSLQASAQVLQLLQPAQQNAAQPASLSPGIGGNLDIAV